MKELDGMKYWKVRVEVCLLRADSLDSRLTNALTFEVYDQSKLEPLFRVVAALLRNPTHYAAEGKMGMEFEDTWLPVGIGE